MSPDGHGNDKITRGAAVSALVALSGNAEELAVVDARRDRDGELFRDPDISLAVAVAAGGLNYLTGSPAVVAGVSGLEDAECRSLRRAHLTCASAGRTGLG